MFSKSSSIGFIHLVIFVSAFVTNASLASVIPLVGYDEDDQPIERFIPSQEYTKVNQDIITSVTDSILKALEKINSKTKWNLRTIIVGIGVSHEIGVGSALKLKESGKLRLVFSNAIEPATP